MPAKLAQRLKRKPALIGLLAVAALGGFLVLRRGAGGGVEEPDGEFGPGAPGTGIDDGGAGGSADGTLEVLSEIQLLSEQLALDREEQLAELADLRESAGMAFGELASRLEELGADDYADDGGYADDQEDAEADDGPAPRPTFDYNGQVGSLFTPGQWEVVTGLRDVPQSGRAGSPAPGETQVSLAGAATRIVGGPRRPTPPKPPKPKSKPKTRPPKSRPPRPKPPKKRPPKKPPKKPPKRPPRKSPPGRGSGTSGTAPAAVKSRGGGGSSTVKAM